MYHKAYGIIETLAPLHVGASAGEETGNLNLIFRDQFTQTGIIPGSSIRGRFRADMRQEEGNTEGWYGAEVKKGQPDSTSEGIVKFEYASLLWIPVYCPNQPVVRVSCPGLLRRYQKLAGFPEHEVKPYSFFSFNKEQQVSELFFNLGWLKLKQTDSKLRDYMPDCVSTAKEYLLVVVSNSDMAMIHDMALYRQSRVSLESETKVAKRGAYFNVEALPEGTILAFPIALRKMFQNQPVEMKEFLETAKLNQERELYFGGLESIGFGRTLVTVKPQVQVTK
uniref:RAMP superfamily CRISPR-associated protein n=1 Tax=Trichocoleus desertorum TaxID=1481672 RepID=UPI0025B35FB4|nr:RAMP superfamily CRISPR-associated protein [Trichocoleus desertorum]